jgi:hypothetical protein
MYFHRLNPSPIFGVGVARKISFFNRMRNGKKNRRTRRRQESFSKEEFLIPQSKFRIPHWLGWVGDGPAGQESEERQDESDLQGGGNAPVVSDPTQERGGNPSDPHGEAQD